jgi:hypothetical protein
MSNATILDKPLSDKEVKLIKAIRELKFGEVVVHIQNALPLRIEVKESILL